MFNKVHKPSTKLTILYLSVLHYNINIMEYPGSLDFDLLFNIPISSAGMDICIINKCHCKIGIYQKFRSWC